MAERSEHIEAVICADREIVYISLLDRAGGLVLL